MAATNWGRFVIELFMSGKKNATSYFELLDYGVFKFYGENIPNDDFTLKCTLKYIAH